MQKLSVIVTTYNRPELLKETIQSIINQTYRNFELIVVDNNSNYDFFKLIDGFKDSRIKSFQNDNGGIIAINRNYGIKKSKGEFLAFCDDDDMWIPQKLETQVNFLNKNHLDLVYSNTYALYENQKLVETNHPKINTLKKLILGNNITLSTVLVRNSSNILFNENKTYGGIEDYILWINLKMNSYLFGMVERPLIKYRVLSDSFSRLNKARGEKKIITFFMSLIRKNNIEFLTKLLISYRILKAFFKYIILKIIKK